MLKAVAICFLTTKLSFYLKNLNALAEDLMELKPTLFAGVPRVFERVYEGMKIPVTIINQCS